MTVRTTRLLAPDAVRALEERACVEGGFPSFELMQRAGAAAFRALRERWPQARRIAVVCGTGNNGGDGYVLATLARAEGLAVTVLQIGEPAARGDAQHAWQALKAAGVSVTTETGVLSDVEVIVDALFGIGLNRDMDAQHCALVTRINHASQAAVLSLDIPSGLHSVTGAVMGAAVQASATITFIAHKPGLHTGAARACTGTLMLADLGLGGLASHELPVFAELVGWSAFPALRRPRSPIAHKGDAGHVLVVGGGEGMGGAARLAAEAALRTGAGLVSVATVASSIPSVMAGRPEIMARSVESAADLRPLLARASVVAIGPGLGQTTWARGLWSSVRDAGLPLVVDADALNLLAADPAPGPDWVLTPHPGEAARLLATDNATIARDRYGAALRLQQSYGGSVVLKGAGSIVQTPAGTRVIAGGNPGMASGGMGDVLTGVIAALIAQGLPPQDAAAAGAALHAAAGDAAAQSGARGLLASDLMPHLRRLVN